MSLMCHARNLLHTISKVQQSAHISTAPTILSSCGNKKCPVVKVAGCAPRVRFDCEPVRKRRCKCIRTDVPEPCFSECFRCPPPTPRMTECPDCSIKGLKPPAHCLKPKLGTTIDGCNPRDSIKMLGSCRRRNKACKKVNKPCEFIDPNIPVCDPCIRPFKTYEACNPPPGRPEKRACYASQQDREFDTPTCSLCQANQACIPPFKNYEPCNPPQKQAERRACYAPQQDYEFDAPKCSSCQAKQANSRYSAALESNFIDPHPQCSGTDPSSQLEEPCKHKDSSICCSQNVCNFRTEPRKRDAALSTCRSCAEEMYSKPPNCPICGTCTPRSCPMCGERMDGCRKKPSLLDSLWNLVQGKK